MGCMLCPRQCDALRSQGEKGMCGAGDQLRVARAALHYWEEPPVSGTAGSGAVFFSHCALKCVYCQNWKISRGGVGKDISPERLSEIMLSLQDSGAANINLVSASHYAPGAVQAVTNARAAGLRVPVVWNSSGYETIETLQLIRDVVDVFLPDFKYWSQNTAYQFSAARDYPLVAARAIQKMMHLQPETVFSTNGLIRRGVIVRHLVLPEHTRESKQILRHLREAYGSRVYVSVMRQYTPPDIPVPYAELMRTVRDAEYESVVRYAQRIGLENVFVQGRTSVGNQYVPMFSSDIGQAHG